MLHILRMQMMDKRARKKKRSIKTDNNNKKTIVMITITWVFCCFFFFFEIVHRFFPAALFSKIVIIIFLIFRCINIDYYYVVWYIRQSYGDLFYSARFTPIFFINIFCIFPLFKPKIIFLWFNECVWILNWKCNLKQQQKYRKRKKISKFFLMEKNVRNGET